MVDGGGSGDDTGSRVPDQLRLMEGFMAEARKEGVAVVQARSDKAVKEDGGLREGWRKIDATQVELSRPSNVIDVGLERQCAIEDDTKTLDPRGRGNSAADNDSREAVRFR